MLNVYPWRQEQRISSLIILVCCFFAVVFCAVAVVFFVGHNFIVKSNSYCSKIETVNLAIKKQLLRKKDLEKKYLESRAWLEEQAAKARQTALLVNLKKLSQVPIDMYLVSITCDLKSIKMEGYLMGICQKSLQQFVAALNKEHLKTAASYTEFLEDKIHFLLATLF